MRNRQAHKSAVFSLVFLSLALTACGEKDSKNHRGAAVKPTTGSDECVKISDNSPQDALALTASQKHFELQWQWLNGPVSGDESKARLSFLNAAKQPLAAADVEIHSVKAWMPSMGHGTGKRQPVARALDDKSLQLCGNSLTLVPEQAVFDVTELYFIMGGPWDVTVAASVAGEQDEVVFHVDVP